MLGWQFARVADGWEWYRLSRRGQLSTRSARVFSSLLECLTDATRNGYSVSVPVGLAAPNRQFGD